MPRQRNLLTMPDFASASDDSLVKASVRVLDQLFASYPRRNFQIRFWNGERWGNAASPDFVLVFNRPGALQKLGSLSEVELGESYIFNDFDIEGNIISCFEVADFLMSQNSTWLTGIFSVASRLPGSHGKRRPDSFSPRLNGVLHSRARDRQAISYHYDLPPEFYSLFLGPSMTYSCAYFRAPGDSLDQAQEQKLEYICRKLRLRPGEHVLDIGCGWGSLVTYAARKYGVSALGITLSKRQARFAAGWIHAQRLEDHCRVEFCDYRDLGDSQQFDKIASIGMFEHVGEDLLPEYFRRVAGLLRPAGVFLNHGIACSVSDRRHGRSFVDRYVFPDGDIVPIATTLSAAEASGLEIRDVESLREHYDATLRHWVRCLEQHACQARRITDDVTYRIWRLFMAGSAHAFRAGRLNIYQTLLAKATGGKTKLPLTREDWYDPRG
jgi:cyclopropane-fatty-acyl-phospholipid synthase